MTMRAWTVGVSFVVSAVVAAGTTTSGQQPPRGRGRAAAPRFIAADRHDRSPALRDIRPVPPSAGTIHEMPRVPRPQGPRSIDTVVQGTSTPPLVPTPSLSFDGVGNVNAVLPPDTNGAVGPIHFVQWVNLSFAIYAKGSATVPATLLYGPANGNTLWTGFGGACETTNSGDPVVRYDRLADRWLMSQLAIPNSYFGLLTAPFYQCIAVSATPDPTGPYYRYQFSFDKLNDYPKFGVWPDAYYMTMNQFTAPSLTFAGQGVAAFDRNSMLQGLPAGLVFFDLSSVDMNLASMLPSDLDGPPPPAGAPNTFAQFDDDAWGFSPDQVELWDFHVDWTDTTASSFTHRASVLTAPFDSNLCNGSETCIPQPGTTAKVDALSDRFMYRLQYRNFGDHESLVVNHTVDVDGTDHAGIRWYEIRDPHGAPSIYQQGTYAPDADHRWMGSAAMDGSGDIAVGFSVSGASTYPSVRYAARLATDPLGELSQGETDLVTGGGSQTHSSGRWGDYSMLTVDPSDDCTFWYTQEYYATTSSYGWQTRIGAFSLPSCVPSSSTLPGVSVVATTPTAREAGAIPGVFTVTRTGDTINPLTVSYSVSGTAVPGTNYVALSGTVTIPAGSTSATIVVTPIDNAIVSPPLSIIVTLKADPSYAFGAPGAAVVTLISYSPPDLIETAVTAPTVAAAGGVISVSDTTANQGSGPAGASSTGLYLSKYVFLDSNAVQIGARPVATLWPGASSSGTTAATVPAGTAAGTYYVIAMADSSNAIAETQEFNNTKWSNAVLVGPDLLISALTVPATAAAGGSVTVTDTTLNQGGDTAGASTTSFYLSTNLSVDTSDVLLGGRSVPALAPGASNAATTTLTIPSGTASGLYYILAQADSSNLVAEANESNNVKFVSGTQVGPDLAVSVVSAPTVSGAGGTIVVTDTTINKGAGAADASATGFYLSANLVLDSSDPLLGSRPVPALGAGATSSGSTSLTLPASLATGTYYVIAKADYANAVAESNETNNTMFSAAVRIGPDLTVASTTAPSIAGGGVSIVVGDTTKNQGGGVAGASTTGLYLSTSWMLNSSAVLLGTRSVPPLGPGTTNSGSTSVTLPSNLATGIYYVIASADITNQVVETTETNNAGFGVAVRIGPDLIESAFVAPTSAAAGSVISVNDTVTNQGGGTSSSSTTRFYLSTNLTLDSGDVMVGSRAVAALGPGQSDSGATTVTIPAGTAPATYFLIAVADADGVVAETSETNNTRAVAIQVK